MLRILFVSSEMMPLSKTGGLGDVSFSLPAALRRLGHDVRVLTPFYGSVLQAGIGTGDLLATLPMPGFSEPVELRLYVDPRHGVPIYLLNYPPYYLRYGNIYQDPFGKDWSDNDLRFALLSRMAQEIAQARVSELEWRPQVVHANDWQSGLLPYLLELETRVGASRPATLFTVHNLAYQGIFPASTVTRLGLPQADFNPLGTEYYGQFSFMKTALLYADRITTVSPTYAREIQTKAYGMGLEGLLQARSAVLSGILNGIDTSFWNPEQDASLPATYNADDLSGKQICKATLQQEMGLPVITNRFLFGTVGRLVTQKGMDLVADALPAMLRESGGQFILLGSGDRSLEGRFEALAEQYPEQVAVRFGYDEELAHRIEAGLDLFFMPSRFEPCGLNQMYSLAYGTLPLVRRTGGLADTVIDAEPATMADGTANGFVFDEANSAALQEAFSRALSVYQKPDLWHQMQLLGLRQDFSWDRAAQQYAHLYSQIIRF